MPDNCEVRVTAPSAEEAARLGRTAVERRLAACAQVSGPIVSTYWWEGQMTSAQEWLCVLKTTEPLVDDLAALLRADHTYDVPEIVATAITGGDPAYLAWIEEETRPVARVERPLG